MLTQASVGFVVCGDLDAAHDCQLSYLLQDCSAAIENLLLCVHALGLGAAGLGCIRARSVCKNSRRSFPYLRRLFPSRVVAIGLPGEKKEPRTRFNPAYVHREAW